MDEIEVRPRIESWTDGVATIPSDSMTQPLTLTPTIIIILTAIGNTHTVIVTYSYTVL